MNEMKQKRIRALDAGRGTMLRDGTRTRGRAGLSVLTGLVVLAGLGAAPVPLAAQSAETDVFTPDPPDLPLPLDDPGIHDLQITVPDFVGTILEVELIFEIGSVPVTIDQLEVSLLSPPGTGSSIELFPSGNCGNATAIGAYHFLDAAELNWPPSPTNSCPAPGGTVPPGDYRPNDPDASFTVFDGIAGAGEWILRFELGVGSPGTEIVAADLILTYIPAVSPAALVADPEPLGALSDGNQVFEPGERVEVAPSWRNDGDGPLTLTGKASSFIGPPEATYEMVFFDADYGTVAPDATASCRDSGVCYALEVDDPASRPAPHWDATFEEHLTDADVFDTTKTWTLHFGDSFTDVPRTHLFYSWIEAVLHHGVTTGCGNNGYCPLGTATRSQMPVFVLRAFLGPEFTPEPCVEGEERFDDVPADHLFCPWIEELAERGVVSGCDGENYCPEAPVTRAQMAIFLLKTLEGSDYTPPECSGIFADVDCPSIFADWVEELFHREVTTGCTLEPLNYCPSGTNIRGQMAVFLAKTFGLELYGP